MATKKPTAKKTTAKKTPAKKPAAKRTSGKPASFRLAKSERPFLTFQVTRDTFYWVVLGVVSIAFVSYVLYVQNKVNEIYDQVDMNSTQTQLNYEEIQKIHDSLEKNKAHH